VGVKLQQPGWVDPTGAMGNTTSARNRRQAAGAEPPAAPPPNAPPGAYPGNAAPPPNVPHFVHPNMYGGQRPAPNGIQGMFPYVDGSRPPELRGANLYPWMPMPRQRMPQMQKTYTIKNDVNLKKATLKLVPDSSAGKFHIQFDFDASTDCRVMVYFVATEVEGQAATYAPRDGDPVPSSKTFAKGLGQTFRTESGSPLVIASYSEEELKYNPQEPRRYPVIIRLEAMADTGEGSSSSDAAAGDRKGPAVQSQSTFATLVPQGSSWTLRVLKQTIQVGKKSFELQEIYGIEQNQNGAAEQSTVNDLDDENGRECVICMTEPRDTTVLPCRHMCMCNKCAKVLRLQTNKCPICRCNVESLLQIKVNRAEKPEGAAAGKAPGSSLADKPVVPQAGAEGAAATASTSGAGPSTAHA